MRFVLDTSVAMRWVLGGGMPRETKLASDVLASLKAATAVVPGLFWFEVTSVLRQSEKAGVLVEADIEAFIAALLGADIATETSEPQRALRAALELARRHNLSPYDAAFLELALRQALPLATLDAGLSRAARRAGAMEFKPAA